MPHVSRSLRAAVALATCAGFLLPLSSAQALGPGPADAVVVAIIDSGISPYHWDFLASKMPQAKTKTRSDDLPLTRPPHTWLPGFPKPSAFTSYNEMKLTLDARDEDAELKALHAKDAKKWQSVKFSGPEAVNYYWMPGTKVIGALSFDYEEQVQEAVDRKQGYKMVPIYGEGGSEHGMGTASVSTGNLFGTCPECLVVFIQSGDTTSTERALAWAQSQPWIDVVSNSYGLQALPVGQARDGLYGGPTETQKRASERGQTIVFSAGNGIENGFAVPFSTLTSSIKGPDWVITVGATHPSNKSQYTGSGKPVDVAGIGERYPSAYGATSVTGGRSFSGTSNAAPTISGTYARGLYYARRAMAGPSRVQSRGVISVGKATCGPIRPACEAGDGKLTAVELRDRLLKGAVSTRGGATPAGLAPTDRVADEHWAAEGHGTYYARLLQDEAEWLKEFNRFYLPIFGRAAAVPRPRGEKEWFLVDSWCRQHIFGSWNGGYYREGRDTLPGPSPDAPTRTALAVACNGLVKVPEQPRP